MSAHNLNLGRYGEEVARDYLTEKGYRIKERNWRARGGELDLVCTCDGCIVFVEVKTRAEEGMVHPLESLGFKQQKKLLRTAGLYLSRHNMWSSQSRFDFICVTVGREVQIEHIQNAIEFSSVGGGHTPWQPW